MDKKNALKFFPEIAGKIGSRKPALFLDFDGTLAPIADKPELAVLSQETFHVLEEAAKLFVVAVISGRDRADIHRLVGIDNLFYAGNHGLDISGPNDINFRFDEEAKFHISVESAYQELIEKLAHIPGIVIERKKYGIAAHYRLVEEKYLADFESIMENVLRKHPDLKCLLGKKVFELQAKTDWNKGEALLWVMQHLQLDYENTLPFYIGDDTTDEDAFIALDGKGIAIAVRDRPHPTFAEYILQNPLEVHAFLEKLIRR